MAQVGHLSRQGAFAASSTRWQNQSQADVDMLPITATPNASVAQDDTQQSVSPVGDVCAESSNTEDDDVQIVFCAPRRRKKRRRRYGSSTSPSACTHVSRLDSAHYTSPLSQLSLPPADGYLLAKPFDVVTDLPRRKSTGVVHQLESCHLGDDNGILGRAGSLPLISCTASNVQTEQYPWFAEPNYCGASPSQFTSLADSTTWWDQSLPTLQPRPFPTIPWRPLQSDDVDSKKRKHVGDLNEVNPHSGHSRHSVQLSPRTTTTPPKGSSDLHPYQMNGNNFDMCGRSNQDSQVTMSWPIHEWWNAYDTSPSQYGNLSSREPTMPTNMPVPNNTQLNNGYKQQHQLSHRYEHIETHDPWQVQANQVAASSQYGQSSISSRVPVAFSSLQSQFSQQMPYSRALMQSIPNAVLPHSSCSIALDDENTSRSAIVEKPSHTGVRTSSSHVPTSPIPPQPSIRTMPSADIMRRPSLYSIPAWPAASSSTTTMPLTQCSRYQVPVNDTSTCSSVSSDQPLGNGTPIPISVVSQTQEPATRSQANSTAPAKVPSPTSRQPKSSEFQIPDARQGRKHSPNLIVDIAETCQEMFPFAAVAERHDVAIQKVFDTFSAIIQLPLLRNADDRRRHGSLGKRRNKEYRDAKRAMEKAREAERKAETKAMRARVEDAFKKDQAKAQGLLKSAVLNNAREAHGGG
ncbi:hypothetical protein QTJ16_000386 [Diplocarpon rosae]|uniref:Uncharacterized protein n=1 Tax=Diplocarpon rosae TaxID=946125 RepID=A0AAD9WHD1_9HELO|nr:hypothetical protein QTJ16_000386 [Diplocarpon rosae]